MARQYIRALKELMVIGKNIEETEGEEDLRRVVLKWWRRR